MPVIRYGELFAGAGGLSRGLDRAGFECAFHAEIEEFPRRVLRHHWPDVPLYGDVTKLDGRQLVAECGEIDILSGGSPCQGLSVAGKREGLNDPRSQLFYHQMRLWEETGAPLCLWENVNGALANNSGDDFAAVLSAFVGGTVTTPRDGWRSAGVVSGSAGVAAWRVLDARWYAVPQRRRRVFILGSRTGAVDPAEILLEPKGVRRNTPTRSEAREDSPSTSRARAQDASGAVGFYGELGSQGGGVGEDFAPPLKSGGGTSGTKVSAVVVFDERQVTHPENRSNPRVGDPAPTLADPSGSLVVGLDASNQSSTGDVAQTLRGGESRDTTPVVIAFGANDSAQDSSSEVTPTLRVGGKNVEDGGTPVPAVVLVGEQYVMRMLAFGDYVEDDTASSIKARDYKDATDLVIAYDARGFGDGDAVSLNGDHPNRVTDYSPVVFKPSHYTRGKDAAPQGEVVPPLSADADRGDQEAVIVGTPNRSQRQQVDGAMTTTLGCPRRLMPIECERLMSWPDNSTAIPDENGKPASDTVRYKACGNGVVSNVAEWIGWRIREAVNV